VEKYIPKRIRMLSAISRKARARASASENPVAKGLVKIL
jgi:hypothetical protein